MGELRMKVSEDMLSAEVQLPGMAEPQVFTAAELEDLARHFAWLRASMRPEIPRQDLTESTTISSVPCVRWQVAQDDVPAQFRLLLLHPGSGWTHIHMDQASFDQMSSAARVFLQASFSKQ